MTQAAEGNEVMQAAEPAAGPVAKPLSAAEAATALHTTDSTVRKWATAGAVVAGQLVTLRSKFIGSRYYFLPEWLDEFQAACAAARRGEVAAADASDRPHARDLAPKGDSLTNSVMAALASL